jgi:hypothetical protein
VQRDRLTRFLQAQDDQRSRQADIVEIKNRERGGEQAISVLQQRVL